MPETDTLTPETGNSAATTEAAVSAKTDASTADATILTDPPESKPTPGDGWRERMASGDEKELARLARFKSEADYHKSYRAMEKKQSSGELKAKLVPDATPEQLTAWRKDNGIPEKAEDYLAALPKGLVIGDADKPLIDGFLSRVHGKNASPEFVSEALGWYYDQQETLAAEQASTDKAYQQASTDALREEWGGEFRANINSITAFLDAAPATADGKPLKDLLMNARLGDGTQLGNNPAALKWLAQLAHDANPAGFVSPNDGGSQLESVEGKIAAAKLRMQNDPGWPKDTKAHEDYQKLLTARERLAPK